MRYKILVSAALLIGIAILIACQFSLPTIFGADGYLHIRLAEIIKLNGPIKDFHWARYSIFASQFSDKDFLYHVALIPFTFFPDIFFGAKVAACLFAITLFLTLFYLLRTYCRRALVIPLLFAFFISPSFLQAISRPRPMVFTIALTLILVHWLIRKNTVGLFVLAFAYTLTHVTGPYLVFFAVLCEGVRWCNEKEFAWKSVLAVFIGVCAGFYVHPNFPNNILVFYLNAILVPVFALRWGLELGAEFFPIDSREFVTGYPFIFIGLVVLLALSTSRNRKVTLATKMWMSVAGFFFIFSFFSRRYIIHSYPLILVALGAYISDWLDSEERLTALRRSRFFVVAALALSIAGFGFLGARTYRGFLELVRSSLYFNSHYEAVGNWMKEHVPEGEVIFHANWSDSQYFIGLNPKNDYFVTLDPVYMYYWNPEKYQLYREIAFGRTQDPYTLLQKEFAVKYGYAGKNYFSGLINQVRQDPRFVVLAEDALGVIFGLR